MLSAMQPISLEMEGNRAALANTLVGFVGSELANALVGFVGSECETLADCCSAVVVETVVPLPTVAATIGHYLALLGAPPAAVAPAVGAPL